MSTYTFQQLPPGKLLIQLVQKNFTGFLAVHGGEECRIGFVKGRAVRVGGTTSRAPLREALLTLFTDPHRSFTLTRGEPQGGEGVNPLSILREGLLRYSKERLLEETSELLKARLLLNKGFRRYLQYYNFSEEEEAVVEILAENSSSARELAAASGLPLSSILVVLYALALAGLLTLAPYSEQISSVDESALTESARRILAELRTELERMKETDPFKRFGISPESSEETLHLVFKERARKFHPDRMASKGLEAFRGLAQEYFEKLTETYNILKDPEERRRYGESISEEERRSVGRAIEAEVAYQKALIHYRRKEYAEAEEFLRTAVKNVPDDGNYLGLWAWIAYKNPANNRDAIRDTIKGALLEAIDLHKRDANLHYYLGRVLLDAGERGRATQHLQRACALNPDHFEAARTLRLLKKSTGRSRSVRSKTGAFLNLFKKM